MTQGEPQQHVTHERQDESSSLTNLYGVTGYPLSFSSNEFRFQGGLVGVGVPDSAHQYHDDGAGNLKLRTKFRNWDETNLGGSDCPDEESGTTLYLGPLYKHFGHFVTESLARSWPLGLENLAIDRVAFFPQCGSYAERYRLKQRGVAGFQKEALDYLGIAKPLLVTYPTRFEHVIVPEPGFILNRPQLRDEFRDFLVDRAVQHFGRSRAERKLFLLRANDEVVGENVIADFLTRFGYKPFRLEELPFIAQLETVYHASHLVGVRGSAFHAVNVLGSVPARVVFIERAKGHSGFARSIQPFVREVREVKPLGSTSHGVAVPDIHAFLENLAHADDSVRPDEFPWEKYAFELQKELL